MQHRDLGMLCTYTDLRSGRLNVSACSCVEWFLVAFRCPAGRCPTIDSVLVVELIPNGSRMLNRLIDCLGVTRTTYGLVIAGSVTPS